MGINFLNLWAFAAIQHGTETTKLTRHTEVNKRKKSRNERLQQTGNQAVPPWEA